MLLTLSIDVVVADTSLSDTRGSLDTVARELGARLVLAEVASRPRIGSARPTATCRGFPRNLAQPG